MIQRTPQKPQLYIIGGGETFLSNTAYLQWLQKSEIREEKKGDWKQWISDGLADDYEVIRIAMPDRTNALYEAWKIWFEKIVEATTYQCHLPITLIGHSLGGIFLAKYLSETAFFHSIHTLHLVAPVWSYPDESSEPTASFSFQPLTLANITKQVSPVHIWVSEDDTIVSPKDSKKYHQALPGAHLHTFRDRQHFHTVSHFVELFCLLQQEKPSS